MTTTNTATDTTTKAAKIPATPAQIARATAITKHQRAAEAHDAAASAIEAIAPPEQPEADEDTQAAIAETRAGIAEDAAAHRAQATKHRAIAERTSGRAAEPKTPQQITDEAEDRASAASRSAIIADRALRDALMDAQNPNGCPQSGGTEAPTGSDATPGIQDAAPQPATQAEPAEEGKKSRR